MTDSRCRRFGLIMAGFFALLAFSCARHGRALPWPIPLSAAGIFLIAGLAAPRVLEPLERRWMALARFLGAINAAVLLTLFYYLVLAPVAVVARLLGADPLGLRKRDTYWEPVETGRDPRRHEKQF